MNVCAVGIAATVMYLRAHAQQTCLVKPELLADQTGFGKTARAIFSDAEVRRDNAGNTFV
jgi:hypothetical protein